MYPVGNQPLNFLFNALNALNGIYYSPQAVRLLAVKFGRSMAISAEGFQLLTLEGLQSLELVRVSTGEGFQRWGFLRSQIFTCPCSQAGAI